MQLINLTGKGLGLTAIIDDDDLDFTLSWNWSLNSQGYVKRNTTIRKEKSASYKVILLHREIAKRAGLDISNVEVDHINCNKLDNRRDNLRIASRSDNCRNVGIKKSNTTGFKGVSVDKRTNYFRAHIRHSGKKHYLGSFETAEEAHLAYCEAAKKFHGEFARVL